MTADASIHVVVKVIKILLILFIIGIAAYYIGPLSVIASGIGSLLGAVHWLIRRNTTE